MANADCSHKPGSTPTWNYISEQVDCECQSPYSQDPMTGNCIDFMAQLEQDSHEFYQEMENRQKRHIELLEQDRLEFDQEMENRRKRDEEQQQQFYSIMWDKFHRPPTPSRGSKPLPTSGQSQKYNGPLCKGHHLVCGYGYNEYKHAVNDFNQDEICDICGRPYTAKQGYHVLAKKRNPPCVKYYSKLDGPICQGHTLICDQGYGRNWKMAIDRNPRDRICDICGRSFKKSGNKVRGVITKKNVKCKVVTK